MITSINVGHRAGTRRSLLFDYDPVTDLFEAADFGCNRNVTKIRLRD